ERERHPPADGRADLARHLHHRDVAVAEAVARYAHQHLARSHVGHRDLDQPGRLLPVDEPEGPHGLRHDVIPPGRPTTARRAAPAVLAAHAQELSAYGVGVTEPAPPPDSPFLPGVLEGKVAFVT